MRSEGSTHGTDLTPWGPGPGVRYPLCIAGLTGAQGPPQRLLNTPTGRLSAVHLPECQRLSSLHVGLSYFQGEQICSWGEQSREHGLGGPSNPGLCRKKPAAKVDLAGRGAQSACSPDKGPRLPQRLGSLLPLQWSRDVVTKVTSVGPKRAQLLPGWKPLAKGLASIIPFLSTTLTSGTVRQNRGSERLSCLPRATQQAHS